MVWKPKEKKITLEEALILAKKELGPDWFGSEPLIAATYVDQHVQVFPLIQSFKEKPWIMLFADIMEPTGEIAVHCIKEWHKRYHQNGLNFLIVLKASYANLFSSNLIEHFIRKLKIGFPVVMDRNNLLAAGFAITTSPTVVLFSNEKVLFKHNSDELFSETEQKIHGFLRSTDPGLPLLPFYKGKDNHYQKSVKIEFGRGRGLQFPKPGFVLDASGYGIANFKSTRPSYAQLNKNDFHFVGAWAQDGEKIITSDPKAAIHFFSEYPNIGVVAQAMGKTELDRAELVIEVNGAPAYDSYIGEHVTQEDNGQSMVKVENGNLFHVLKKLPADKRSVSFIFPRANQVPIAVYGIRLGASA
jgi:hypothetical protein